MKIKASLGEKVFDFLNVLFMVSLIIATLYPFLYVLFSSLSDPGLLAKNRGILLLPLGFTVKAYELVFQNPMIIVGYLNTIFYVIVGTIINIFLTSIGAYALSRKNAMLTKPIMMFITFTMFFSGGLIPTYLLIGQLGMIDTRWALIIPNAVSVWNLIIMRTSFKGIPDSLEESARIDGANDWTILFRIILPLSLPVIAVMVLFYGVGHWNAYFDAMIYLRNNDLWPLQLVLREILIENSTDNFITGVGGGDRYPIGETVKYATIIVATIPILFLYPFLQKYFVKGVMIGSIKE
ncbi:carbohydrate ABC transporter permease [Lederbergia galactosidilytica]|uniref:Sugar ABC transporter permease n=1 Tax=Lederbergia galactosidilytica TaxID=217031 RepID=A0A178A2V0_9BACI|nr:carbohydrate ABC transporter permease [Lederbergia galactosidilytica]KRG14445.1 sugar ABC transporter permease [Virgibacillus soli]MBP1914975.1 putative aldouronate transport system permease protein [Lederbergia galactosidilytica]OAK74253.1 sugar ABC transporter permease [Lederbergia galactosidilytica]